MLFWRWLLTWLPWRENVALRAQILALRAHILYNETLVQRAEDFVRQNTQLLHENHALRAKLAELLEFRAGEARSLNGQNNSIERGKE